MLATTLIEDVARLSALRGAWEELLTRSSASELSLHPSWLLTWWDTFGGTQGRALRVAAFHDGERLVGLAPLLVRTHRYRPGIPFRRLELLGTGEDPADETCGDYLGVVAEQGREAEVARAFVDAVSSGAVGHWDELVLSSMSGIDPLVGHLQQAFAARGHEARMEEWTTCPYIPLPKTWDAYLAALTSKKRSQVKKVAQVFEAWAGGPPTIIRVKTHEELAEGRRVLESLHGERWGSDGGVFASKRFRAFHAALMTELLAAGRLDLGWLEVRGEPVAAFYNFRFAGKLYFYQAGRRLDLPDEIRIGMTMHVYLIRSAIEDGLREYDFLAGDSQYKRAFALGSRPLVSLRIARPSVRERARLASDRGIDVLKRIRDRARRDLPGRTPAPLLPILEKVLARL